jgi:hypothetical protein
MNLQMENEVNIPQFSITGDMDSSSESRKTNMNRIRKILLMLLGIMFVSEENLFDLILL